MLIGDSGPTDTPRVPVAAFINGSTEPPPLELRAGRAHRIRWVSNSAALVRRVRLVSDSGVEIWRAVSKDGADLPPRQATSRPASIDLGPGETVDFEILRSGREPLTLEVITAPRAPKPHVLRIPVIVRWRPAEPRFGDRTARCHPLHPAPGHRVEPEKHRNVRGGRLAVAAHF